MNKLFVTYRLSAEPREVHLHSCSNHCRTVRQRSIRCSINHNGIIKCHQRASPHPMHLAPLSLHIHTHLRLSNSRIQRQGNRRTTIGEVCRHFHHGLVPHVTTICLLNREQTIGQCIGCLHTREVQLHSSSTTVALVSVGAVPSVVPLTGNGIIKCHQRTSPHPMHPSPLSPHSSHVPALHRTLNPASRQRQPPLVKSLLFPFTLGSACSSYHHHRLNTQP